MVKARIFNIQRFSTHDGPGIRTTVFFKGCNLRCQWCHNPESYTGNIQLEYFRDRCIECRKCEEVCLSGITLDNRITGKMDGCVVCGKCYVVCMHEAIKIV